MEGKSQKISLLEEEIAKENFWDNKKKAYSRISELKGLKHVVSLYNEIFKGVEDLGLLVNLGIDELSEDFEEEHSSLVNKLEVLEMEKMLSGEFDGRDCFFTLTAGAGGVDACDWVDILSRMYTKWAHKKQWECKEIDILKGEVAGIKSVTYKFSGYFAYGYAKAERGVHRLVRISPFDSNARRHTSFASVEVLPDLGDNPLCEIKQEELKVDTFRASGAGGQHVNTTDSAVRITHLPSKIVVTCQNERSQIQNREVCMKMLESKLSALQIKKREEQLSNIVGEKRKIEWGSQIRSYFFHPKKFVKDLRTNRRENNLEAILDGDIDNLVNDYLRKFG